MNRSYCRRSSILFEVISLWNLWRNYEGKDFPHILLWELSNQWTSCRLGWKYLRNSSLAFDRMFFLTGLWMASFFPLLRPMNLAVIRNLLCSIMFCGLFCSMIIDAFVNESTKQTSVSSTCICSFRFSLKALSRSSFHPTSTSTSKCQMNRSVFDRLNRYQFGFRFDFRILFDSVSLQILDLPKNLIWGKRKRRNVKKQNKKEQISASFAISKTIFLEVYHSYKPSPPEVSILWKTTWILEIEKLLPYLR